MTAAGTVLWLVCFLAADAPGAADLFRRGDQLAREKKYAEALRQWKDAYLKGLILCWKLAEGTPGAWDGVNAAFGDPPSSTEQVLHPEKYRRGATDLDEPVALELPGSGPLLPGEWDLVKDNVLGELQIEILLRASLGSRTSEAAAAGWDGDLYRVYRRKERSGATCLVWVSEWDTKDDARELAEAFEKHIGKLSGEKDGSFVLTRGKGVTVIVGAGGADAAEAPAEWASRFTSAPKRIEFRAFKSAIQFPEGSRER